MTHGDDDGLRLPPAIAPQPDRHRADAARQAGRRRAARLLRRRWRRAELHERVRRAASACCVDKKPAQVGRQALGLGAPRRAAHPRDRPARCGRRQGHATCAAIACATATRSCRTPRRAAEFVAGAQRLLEKFRRVCSPKPRRGSTATSSPASDVRRARRIFRRGRGRRRKGRRVQGLGERRLVEAGRGAAGGDRGKVKIAQADDSQRAARPEAGRGGVPVHRGIRRGSTY